MRLSLRQSHGRVSKTGDFVRMSRMCYSSNHRMIDPFSKLQVLTKSMESVTYGSMSIL